MVDCEACSSHMWARPGPGAGQVRTSTPIFLGGAQPTPEGSQTEGGLKPLRQAPGPGVGGAGRWGMGRKGQEEMGAAWSGPC